MRIVLPIRRGFVNESWSSVGVGVGTVEPGVNARFDRVDTFPESSLRGFELAEGVTEVRELFIELLFDTWEAYQRQRRAGKSGNCCS